jgi:peptidoglycan/xylan/chitin deacetylase (PgdA/CDA1 family)
MLAPVILYHKIDAPARDALVRGGYTPVRRFAKQMAHLKKQGFIFYSASELIGYYRSHGSFPPRGITITFDDGWRDNYLHAFPVLRELGIKATIFLGPTCIGQVSTRALAPGEGARAHLSRDEILEMSRHGIEFGSHSLNHRLLHELPLQEVKLEVEEAKKQIEALVDKPCTVFAYPAGYFSEATQRVLQDSGHIAAFSTIYGPTSSLDLYAINRIEILRRDRFLFQFASKIAPLR